MYAQTPLRRRRSGKPATLPKALPKYCRRRLPARWSLNLASRDSRAKLPIICPAISDSPTTEWRPVRYRSAAILRKRSNGSKPTRVRRRRKENKGGRQSHSIKQFERVASFWFGRRVPSQRTPQFLRDLEDFGNDENLQPITGWMHPGSNICRCPPEANTRRCQKDILRKICRVDTRYSDPRLLHGFKTCYSARR